MLKTLEEPICCHGAGGGGRPAGGCLSPHRHCLLCPKSGCSSLETSGGASGKATFKACGRREGGNSCWDTGHPPGFHIMATSSKEEGQGAGPSRPHVLPIAPPWASHTTPMAFPRHPTSFPRGPPRPSQAPCTSFPPSSMSFPCLPRSCLMVGDRSYGNGPYCWGGVLVTQGCGDAQSPLLEKGLSHHPAPPLLLLLPSPRVGPTETGGLWGEARPGLACWTPPGRIRGDGDTQ